MKNTHHPHRIVPFEGGLKNLLGDFWSFPTVFDSPLWDQNQSFLPAMDIKELQKSFEIIADLPGFDPKNIQVEVENDGIIISGKHEKKEESNKANYLRMERSMGSFYRKISFPPSADLEHVTCRSMHGVLTVIIPKRSEAQKKSLPIEVQ